MRTSQNLNCACGYMPSISDTRSQVAHLVRATDGNSEGPGSNFGWFSCLFLFPFNTNSANKVHRHISCTAMKLSLQKLCSLVKKHPPPTFGPISCIQSRSKLNWVPTLEGVCRCALLELEKHNLKRYAYLR